MNKFNVTFTDNATIEFDSILLYMTKDLSNSKAALEWFNDFGKQIENISYFPYSGVAVNFEVDSNLRKIFVGNFVAIYSIEAERQTINILHIFYALSDWERNI